MTPQAWNALTPEQKDKAREARNKAGIKSRSERKVAAVKSGGKDDEEERKLAAISTRRVPVKLEDGVAVKEEELNEEEMIYKENEDSSVSSASVISLDSEPPTRTIRMTQRAISAKKKAKAPEKVPSSTRTKTKRGKQPARKAKSSRSKST